MQKPTLVSFVLALASPTLAAQSHPFNVQPATSLRGIASHPAELLEVVAGDFDDDGVADLVVLDSDGEVGLLFAHGERQLGRIIDVDAARSIALHPRDGADGLFIATAGGVVHWELDTNGDDDITSVNGIDVARVHYGHLDGHPWGCLWTVHDGDCHVQGFIVDPSSGAQIAAAGPLTVTGDIGASTIVDVDQDGLYEFAITLEGGCIVFDSVGTTIAVSLRALTGSDTGDDRLVCAIDDDGSQRVVWAEVDGTSGRLHVLDASGVEVASYTAGSVGALAAAFVDGDDLADIVLPGTEESEMRILFAQAGSPRYGSTGAATALQPLWNVDLAETARTAAVADLDRDGDPDVVGVARREVFQLRNDRVRDDLHMPYVDLASSVETNAAETHVIVDLTLTAPPAPVSAAYDTARIRVYYHTGNTEQLEREEDPAFVVTEPITGWPHVTTFSVPVAEWPEIAYAELELIEDATATEPEVVHTSMVMVLTLDDPQWCVNRAAPGDRLWILPLFETEVFAMEDSSSDSGNGTHGSSAIPVIPRLPPPPPPPPPL